MTSVAHAHILLNRWGEWSRTGGIIPKKLEYALARWQSEVPSDYPEEPEHVGSFDDDEMSLVDRVVAEIGRTHVRYYVVLLDMFRNSREYGRDVEEEAVQHFANLYNLKTMHQKYA